MSTTYTGANLVLNALLTSGGSKYLGLHTVVPTRNTAGMEVSGGGYARQGIAFSPPANGATSSTAAVQFPTATAYWGSVESFGVYDAASGGTLLWFDVLTDANGAPSVKTVTAGDIFQVPAGKIVLSVD